MWRNSDEQIYYKNFINKYNFIFVLFIILFILLSIRLFFLQIIKGKQYVIISERQRIFSRYEHAPRGIIYSADNVVLAENKFTYAILFYTQQNQNKLINKLNDFLENEINLYSTNNIFTKFTYNLSMAEVLKILERKANPNNFMVLKEAHRIYHNPKAISHIIGYISEIKRNELQLGYNNIGDYVGRGGIEQSYNDYLKGTNGQLQIEVNAKGLQTKVFKYIPPTIGADVYSTIDISLQKVAYNALKQSSTGRGAVVVLDIKTGAIKVLVSSPGFNINKMSTNQFNKYCLDKSAPFFNRAIQGIYSPGSIFKIITLIAAMEALNINKSDIIHCPGYFKLGNRHYLCWYKSGHGKVNLIDAIALSCNVYFYQLGVQLSINTLIKYAKMFFINSKTGIDLPNEKRGFIPTPTWKYNKLHTSWFQGDTAIFAVGQGALGVTVLQMAYIMSGIANNGIFYQPYSVDRIIHNGKIIYKHIKKYKQIDLSRTTLQLIQKALFEVVEHGTGIKCKLNSVKIAGKTGTAQNSRGKPHAWFVSYAPVNNPEIAIAVIVENGGSGGTNAVPISKQIYKSYFKLK
ncbi:MAG: penicillin-binding protein 2 [Endomicrobium sp.]|jgi:penicillin-binding protein 2|nr:penicillin-binding protein 2 [Endomicrobium sp.]